LIGQNIDSVIVDGSTNGHVFSVSTDSIYIKGFTIQNSSSGAGVMVLSDYNTILANKIKDNGYGIHLNLSHYSAISDNDISGNDRGIHLGSSSNNIVVLNELSNNSYGMYSQNSSANNIYHNAFTDNGQNAYDDGADNNWDDGYFYLSGGNYWDDYLGTDTLSGLYQDGPGSDGIGDTPYAVGGGFNQDDYPLMEPWVGSLPLVLVCGDANNDGLVTIVDVVYIINYLFRAGTPPVPVVCVGDANGDGQTSISDVVYLNGYILKSATPPVDHCCW